MQVAAEGEDELEEELEQVIYKYVPPEPKDWITQGEREVGSGREGEGERGRRYEKGDRGGEKLRIGRGMREGESMS